MGPSMAQCSFATFPLERMWVSLRSDDMGRDVGGAILEQYGQHRG